MGTMQKVSLPPLRSGLQVSVAAREPPERSWTRYKKVLIDNPRDSNLLQRQKLWNFQKLNRGAFRSQLASLPDIPYRVHTNTVERVSVGVQADLTHRFNQGLRVIFPNLTAYRSWCLSEQPENDASDEGLTSEQRNKACSPMTAHVNTTDYSDDFEDDSSYEDLGFDFDTVVRKHNAGTMTDSKWNGERLPIHRERRKKTVRERNAAAGKRSILKTKKTPRPFSATRKNVKFNSNENTDDSQDVLEFEHPDVESAEEEETPVVPKIEITGLEREPPISRVSSALSVSSSDSHGSPLTLPLGNIGHSSHLSLENLSILDYISGNNTERSYRGNGRKAYTSREEVSRGQLADRDADRQWFEKLVGGDKEIVNVATYDNFARVRPMLESGQSDSNDKLDFKQPLRKNQTPKLNDEFPAYRQVISKAGHPAKGVSSSPSVNRGKRRGTFNIGKFY
ncbi:uncharacterized protein LOC128232409 [Mya arenaria]|uniref:uncharacterized protein LOC128232409 n=1 Tax=Mya arenaria TaxID=6604 RepID=UPI0022E262F7|nr:uncharacterized protein LOC128232409 [Mya arenaria]XP_052801894.1 uncharacterized protein LOC128232409 [Mya arenaria]